MKDNIGYEHVKLMKRIQKINALIVKQRVKNINLNKNN